MTPSFLHYFTTGNILIQPAGTPRVRTFLLILTATLYFLSIAAVASAGSISAVAIDTVIVRGNRSTQDFVIRTEIEAHPGAMVDSSALERDRKRLESLGLFSRAQLSLDTLKTGEHALIVQVTELWYVWPSVFLAIDEDNPSRFGFGLLVSHGNFRGRRETVDLSARFGYIEGQEFSWDIPYLSKEDREWSLKLEAKSTREHEPRSLLDWEGIDKIERSFDARFGRRYKLENRLWTAVDLSQIRFSAHDNRTLNLTENSGNLGDLNGGVAVGFIRDTRHYKPWASQGYRAAIHLSSTTGLNYSSRTFLQPGITLATYTSPHPRVHLASSVDTQWIVGPSLRYRRLLLDRDNGVRSPMETAYEGTWRGLASIELRGDIIPIQYISFKPTFDFLDPYARDLKIGLSGMLFVDGGAVGGTPPASSTTTFETKATDGWEVSYGIGLVLHVPYRDIVRFEIARSYRFPDSGYRVLVRIGPSF